MAMAAALGIGRFVYTPILPAMLEALGWSKVDAGLVASANFLGYLIGALVAGWRPFAANPRRWLQIALAVSAATTLGMAATPTIATLAALRFIGGVASAFVIICASTLVLDRLAAAGRGPLSAVHFSGVGAGIVVSAAVVAALRDGQAGWQQLWLAAGLAAALMAVLAALLIGPGGANTTAMQAPAERRQRGLAPMIVAYGLFGFGYVITTTFLVTIVRDAPAIRALEPWIWILFGLAAVPSVPVWQMLGRRFGLMRAFAVACLVEAIGVAASVEWVSLAGVCVAAVLLGGTFMGLTALGLMVGRSLSGGAPQQVIGMMTASFSIGQMIGPSIAGVLSEQTGSFRAASLSAAAALIVAAVLAATAADG
jgi:predicted MFS family arabinose efflux permease